MAAQEDLLQALKCATDQNPAVLKQAEEWLRNKESDGTFYVSLSEICHLYDIEWTIRWMAIVYLKNGIDRYWRASTAGSLSTENKGQIRSNIMHCLEEPVHQIATQCSVVIAKIARFDYPEEWNDLISVLLSGLISPRTPVHLSRCLLVLKNVIKMLSTKKLPHAKEVFSELCKSIFNDVFQFWISSNEALKKTIQNSGSIEINIIENHVTLTRTVKSMIQDYGPEITQKLYEIFLRNLSEMITLSQHCKDAEKAQYSCLKTSVIMVKMLDSLLSVSQESYLFGAQRVMSLISDQIHTNTLTRTDNELMEKFIIKCMNVCKSVLDNGNFENTFLGGGTDISAIAPGLETLFQCLVCHYLPLKEDDLESWEDDPESFSNEEVEVGESWQFNIRPSAEILALTMLKKFSDLLVPSLLNMLKVVQDLNVHNVSSSLLEANDVLQVIFKGCKTPLECMVRKEAVYYMIGLGVYDVLESINFEEWLMNKLLPEVKAIQNDAHGKLIHRRVLWLISQWAEIRPSDTLRLILYEFVVTSLGKSFDLAVRLAASSTVQYLLDDFEFDITQFKEYQDSCFQGLFDLLLDTRSCDTKMRILNVFNYLIERLGTFILPYEKKISSIIPPLWDHAVSQNHDMLKCAIMGTMIQFLLALKEKSDSISHLSLPLIKESTDLNSPSHVYLLEDGLELWLVTVQNCNEPSEGLFSLFNNMFGLLEYGSETLKVCFSIIEAYVLLYRGAMITLYGALLDDSFLSLATDVRNECLVLISKTVASIFEVTPRDAALPCMRYSGDAFKRVFSENDSVLLSANFTLSAHMVLKNTAQFLQQIQAIGQETGQDFNGLLQGFLKIWCESIDTIVEVDKKKLSALALLTLCSSLTEIPAIANSFADVICAVVQVLYDVCDEHHVDMWLDESTGDAFGAHQLQEETLHDKRRRLLRKTSPVIVMSLPAFASQKFKSLQEKLPQQSFSQLFSSVNAETVSELQNFLSAY